MTIFLNFILNLKFFNFLNFSEKYFFGKTFFKKIFLRIFDFSKKSKSQGIRQFFFHGNPGKVEWDPCLLDDTGAGDNERGRGLMTLFVLIGRKKRSLTFWASSVWNPPWKYWLWVSLCIGAPIWGISGTWWISSSSSQGNMMVGHYGLLLPLFLITNPMICMSSFWPNWAVSD